MRSFLLVALLAGASCWAFQDGVARTPPMGWSSWNSFSGNINEQIIRETADALVSSGMRDAGYVYVSIDDGWASGRDADGNLVPDPVKFPSGMKALADYVHDRGLKFGIYTSCTYRTCLGLPGSKEHEQQDAALFAEWGVDYVKCDLCFADGDFAPLAFVAMRKALLATGRPILYNAAAGYSPANWNWGPDLAELWRTNLDIVPSLASVLSIAASYNNDERGRYAGPGRWNDPDMMVAGMPQLSIGESRINLGLWSILAAPLIAGNDVRNMNEETRALLTNRDLIAIDQDILGRCGRTHSAEGPVSVWVRPLADQRAAVLVVNAGDAPIQRSISASLLGNDSQSARFYDVFAQQSLGEQNFINVDVPAHDAVMLRLDPVTTPPLEPTLLVRFSKIEKKRNGEDWLLRFSRTVDRQSALFEARYFLDNSTEALAEELLEDGRTVRLRVLSPNGATVLNIDGLKPSASGLLPGPAVRSMIAIPNSVATWLRGRVFGNPYAARVLQDGKLSNVSGLLPSDPPIELNLSRSMSVVAVRVQANNSAALPELTFESSTDRQEWANLYSFEQCPRTGRPQWILFDQPVSARALRLNNNGLYMVLNEVQYFGLKE